MNTTEQKIQQIKEILSLPNQQYFMFEGGSGGEFLVDLISSVSSKYKPHTTAINGTLNKTEINRPKMFVLFSVLSPYFEFTKKDGIDELAQQLIDPIFNKTYILRVLNDEDMDEGKSYISASDKIFLHKLHLNKSSFFNGDNSFVLYPDTLEWDVYGNILSTIKNRANELEVREQIVADRIRAYKMHKNAYVSGMASYLEQLIKTHDLELEPMHIDFLIDFSGLDSSMWKEMVKVVMSSTLTELINQRLSEFTEHVALAYKARQNKVNDILQTKNPPKAIGMSSIFEKGALDAIFEIPEDKSDYVHDEILAWHQRNMDLLKQHGIKFADPLAKK